MDLRTALILSTAAIALDACNRKPAGEPAQAAPPKPAAPARTNPVEAVPLTDTTLSALEPAGLQDGRCAWVRLDPAANRRAEVASFERACAGGEVSWSGDGRHAIVSFRNPETDALALFVVEVSSGKTVAVPPPPESQGMRASEFGLTTQDAPMALVVESLDDAQREKGEVEVDGRKVTLPTGGEGLPALAHAMRWRGGKWERFETKPTTEGADYSEGTMGLAARSQLGARTPEILVPHFQGDSADESMVKSLAQFAPADDSEGGWIRVGTPGGRAYVWEQPSEFAFTTGPLVLENPKLGKAPQSPFGTEDSIAVRTEGSFLLATSSPDGSMPRLYDLRSGGLVWSSEKVVAAVFWPRARPRPEHD